MKDLERINNPHGDDRVSDACSIFGMMDTSGRRFGGTDIVKAMTLMHDRGNGLGAGFAVYGLYPNFPEHYALHIMYLSREAQQQAEAFLQDQFRIDLAEEVTTRPTPAIVNPPLIRRYFAHIHPHRLEGRLEDDYVVSQVMRINTQMADAFVFSSGKDMGVFKGVGYPEDIAHFFCLEQEYQGYIWTAHSRFPTNTPGWWGGAHPFSVLDWTVIHNGEISSYGINRRHLEMYGYHCTMHTDTEVIAYAVDLLIRKHELPLDIVADILAPPLWSEIDRQPPEKKAFYTALRQVYGSLLLNGPFTVVIAHRGEMIGFTDRIRLRPLTAATRGDMLYLSSEESAIRLVSPRLERAWIPMGGEPIVGRLKAPVPAKAAKAAVKESVSR